MSISYGLPFLGSKNKIAERIIDILPEAEYFIDLFGGGGALTHCVSNKFFHKYKKIIYNELNTDVYKIFKDACSGNIKKFDWLSHEDYKKIRYTNNICFESLILFSMFNNLNYGYLINKKDYDLYKSMYDYIFEDENDFLNRYIYIKNKIKKENNYHSRLILFERFRRCLNINKTLKNKNIEFYNLSYENVTIPENSVIVCDPPYKDTIDYACYFNHEKFYKYCLNSNNMIFICEYQMPSDFYLIDEFAIHSIYHQRIERLYCNKDYKRLFGIEDLF